jgi:pimeloyl-ACP methyl ester carboxylesterase
MRSGRRFIAAVAASRNVPLCLQSVILRRTCADPTVNPRPGLTIQSVMKRSALGLLAFSCICAAFIAPPSTRVSGAEAQIAADVQKLDAADVQTLEAATAFVRQRNARDYALATPNGVEEGRYVTIGGIEQWITIRGEDRRNPVLLFLHGGPGDTTNPWGYAAFRSWLKAFTVVQWDQRGAGRTLGKSGPSVAATLTIDRMTQDGIELAEMLRRTLQKDKIILVGHSWGSLLGIFMAKARPDLFSAFVGTGQVADPKRNYAVAYDALLEKATRLGEARAVRELKEVGPPPYADGRGYGVQRRWSNLFEGADFFIASMVGFALNAPDYRPRDITDWFGGQMLSAERLVPQTSATSALTATALGGDFAIPVFVFQGAEDFTTPTSLARTLVQSIRAPRKAFVTIPGAGHFAVFMKRDAFLHELTARVLPR